MLSEEVSFKAIFPSETKQSVYHGRNMGSVAVVKVALFQSVYRQSVFLAGDESCMNAAKQ